jgi:riboflavin kinase/FMN adenylyltransferase
VDLISGGAALPGHLRGGIVALGNFDGFHAGHQAVVGAARDWARKLDRPALVASFDPHPARLLQPDVPSFSLSTIEQRGEWLRAFGMGGAVVMPFNRALAALSAEEFVSEWLVTRLGVAGVVTGGDFTFGRGRSGEAGRPAVRSERGDGRGGYAGKPHRQRHHRLGVRSLTRAST